jgi:hypothetical protein
MRVDFEHVKHVVVTVLKCEDDSVTARCLDERRLERTMALRRTLHPDSVRQTWYANGIT